MKHGEGEGLWEKVAWGLLFRGAPLAGVGGRGLLIDLFGVAGAGGWGGREVRASMWVLPMLMSGMRKIGN